MQNRTLTLYRYKQAKEMEWSKRKEGDLFLTLDILERKMEAG